MDFFFRHCAVVVLFSPHNQPEVGQKNCGPMISIVTLDNVERSPSACRGLKRLSQSDRVPSVLEDLMGEPVWTSALRVSV